jgi:ATP-dependent DNA ligase
MRHHYFILTPGRLPLVNSIPARQRVLAISSVSAKSIACPLRSSSPNSQAQSITLLRVGWIHEVKHDGYRTILIIERRKARAYTRRFPVRREK